MHNTDIRELTRSGLWRARRGPQAGSSTGNEGRPPAAAGTKEPVRGASLFPLAEQLTLVDPRNIRRVRDSAASSAATV